MREINKNIILIIILLSIIGSFNAIDFGIIINETHVLINKTEIYLIVNCSSDNYTDDINHNLFPHPDKDFVLPETNQSLFYWANNEYKRFSCQSENKSRVCLTCINQSSDPIGYQCQCDTNEFNSRYFDWSTRKFKSYCMKLLDLCDQCHKYNTDKCQKLNETAVNCKCQMGYDPSTKCYTKYNPCQSRPTGSSLSGNQACSVTNGNTCLPYIGTQNYFCQCFYPYKENRELGFPNCLQKITSFCASIICLNGGKCNPNYGINNDTTRCICPESFSGPHCKIRRHQFIGQWSQWTACYPECGNYGVRYSTAVCSSKGSNKRQGYADMFCIGLAKKWERCAPMNCNLQLLTKSKNLTMGSLRQELIKLLTLTDEEYHQVIYILFLGGVVVGLIYIMISEVIGR